jgi:hypothetical protein
MSCNHHPICRLYRERHDRFPEDAMNKKLLIAIVAALPLSACVGYGGGGYGYNGSFDGPVSYDGYYDDYYGPIYDGYWGDGGVFYYRNSEHGHFRPDRSGHFRHDMGGGPGGPGQGPNGGPGGFHGRNGGHGGQFHPMHGMFTPPAPHGGGHH